MITPSPQLEVVGDPVQELKIPENHELSTSVRVRVNLTDIASAEPSSMAEARTIAYAIYLLTREQAVTTNYLLNLQDTLKRAFWAKTWNTDLTSAYLAASWQLLQKADTANSLIRGYQSGKVPKSECGDFFDEFSADSRYLALLARHFPDLLRKVTTQEFERILALIGEGRYNKLSAAYAVLALKSYAQLIALNPPKLSIAGLTLEGKLVQRAPIPIDYTKLLFGNRGGPAVKASFLEKRSCPGLGSFCLSARASRRQVPEDLSEKLHTGIFSMKQIVCRGLPMMINKGLGDAKSFIAGDRDGLRKCRVLEK